MMPDITPTKWVIAIAVAAVLAALIFGGWAWAGGLILGLIAAFVVVTLIVLSNTKFT